MENFHPTHTVVGMERQSPLIQAALLDKVLPEMEIIAWCQNMNDAEIICVTWQEMNTERYYCVIKKKE